MAAPERIFNELVQELSGATGDRGPAEAAAMGNNDGDANADEEPGKGAARR